MVKKNVDLVISAKDNGASVTVSRIDKAVKQFNETQKRLVESGKTTNGGLTSLGESFNKFKTSVNGVTLNKTAAEMGKLGAATVNLSDKTKRLMAEQSGLKTKIADTTKEMIKLQSKVIGAAKAETTMIARLKNRKDVQGRANAALKEATALSKKATTDANKLATAHKNASAKLVSAAANHNRWAKAVASATAATKKQTDALGKAKTKAVAYTADLKKITAALKAQKISQSEAAAAVTKAQAAYDRSGAALEKQANVTKRVTQNHRLLQQSIQAASSQQQRLAKSVTRTNDALQRQAAVGNRVTSVQRRHRTATVSLGQAYKGLYGDARRALSVTQRLRGQVLSLIAAYAGFYGTVNILGKVVAAHQTLEAAQARLNVVFEGNESLAAAEMEFLRETANRLGLELGVLAQEYSKFSIATKNTALEGANTRKIFLAVSEAAVVNRSSTQEMAGVFVALTQIVSKGAVQMEELRQQLGDRLPGALQIMADGLDVSTAKLIKMMEQGQVSAEALVPFAEELTKRFGPGLADALNGTTVQIGKMKNATFNAMVAFGNQGFLESFTQLMKDITETMESAQWEDFSQRLSTLFAAITSAVGFAVKNFDLFVIAITYVIAKKSILFFAALGKQIGLITPAARAATLALTIMGSRFAVVTAAVGRLSIALKVLLGSTGFGLAILAIGALIGVWVTSTTDATAAMKLHEDVVRDVKAAYDEAGGAVEGWADKIKTVSLLQAQQALSELSSIAETSRRTLGNELAKLTVDLDRFGLASRDTINVLFDLKTQFSRGEISAAEFKQGVSDIFNDIDLSEAERARLVVLGLFEGLDELVETEGRVRDLNDVIGVLTGPIEDVAAGMDRLNDVAQQDKAAALLAAEQQAKKFSDAMAVLKGLVVGVADELEDMADRNALEEAFQAAKDAAVDIMAVKDAVDAYNISLNSMNEFDAGELLGEFTDGVEAATALITHFEGFRSEAYNDPKTDRNGNQVGPDVYRAGYGSDTITLADGSILKITKGMRVSVADANRDLNRRIGEFVDVVKGQIGGDKFDSFNAQQQASLASIAYNYGSLPQSIVDAVRKGTNDEISRAIVGLSGQNGGVNDGRRGIEAGAFTTGAGTESAIEEANALAEAAADRLESQKEFNVEQLASIAQADFERQIENDGLIARETAKALREKELEYQAEGLTMTQAQKDEIIRITEEKFRQQALDESAEASAEAIAVAEQIVNDLISERGSLQEQLDIARASGETGETDALSDRIKAINLELVEATDNAIAMWKAVGGPESAAAISSLETARIKAENFGNSANKIYADWSKVGDMLVNKIASAFDQFAKAVADGVPVWQAAREAFLRFAGDFLIEIAQMILKQAIFNALKAAFGGTGLGELIGLAHSGGVINGSQSQSRSVSPGIFSGAPRYHQGGVIGLKPGEIPIIAQREEEMLTRKDPRHVMNGGLNPQGGAAAPVVNDIKVVVPLNSARVLEEALGDSEGQHVLLAYIQENSDDINVRLGK